MIAALARELHRWLGTPWASGQSFPGVGADCLTFPVAVLDALYGIHADTVKAVPPLVCYQPRRAAREAIRQFVTRWPMQPLRVRPCVLQPGDLVLARVGREAGHLMIVGYERNTLWHASSRGVDVTGWGSLRSVMRAWRTDKRSWGL